MTRKLLRRYWQAIACLMTCAVCSILAIRGDVKGSPLPVARVEQDDSPLPRGALLRLGSTRWRHQAPVAALALSPDGKCVASAGDLLESPYSAGEKDCIVRLWDASAGKERNSFAVRDTVLRSLVFSSDGKHLVCAGLHRISLLDLDRATVVRVWEGGSRCIVREPKGSSVLACAQGTKFRVLDVTKDAVRSFRGEHNGVITAVAFSSDGHYLASGGEDHQIKVWEYKTGREVFSAQQNDITSLTFASQDKVLVSAGLKEPVRVWDLANGEQRARLQTGSDGDICLACSPDGSEIIAGGMDGSIRCWNLRTTERVAEFSAHSDPVTSILVAPRERCILTGGEDGTIRVWDLKTRQERATIPGHTDFVRSIAFSSDGRLLVSSSADHSLRLWDTHTGEALRRVCDPETTIRDLMFSTTQDDSFVCGGAEAEKSTMPITWRLGIGQRGELQHLRGNVRFCSFSLDRTLVVALDSRHSVLRISNFLSNTSPVEIQLDVSFPTALALSPRGNLVAALFPDGSVGAWETHQGKECLRSKGKKPAGKSCLVQFCSDQHLIVWDGLTNLSVWDITAHNRLRSLTIECESSKVAAVSPDGKLLALANADKEVRLFDVLSGQQIREIQAPHLIHSLAFSPDSGMLATAGGGDYAILLWDLTEILATNPEPTPAPNVRTRLHALWNELGSSDARIAMRACRQLLRLHEPLPSFIIENLRAGDRRDVDHLEKYIDELDVSDFAQRQKAYHER
jgi:WD40 repeat protein